MRFTVRAPHFKTIDLYQSYFSLLMLYKKETPDMDPGFLLFKSKRVFRLSALGHRYLCHRTEVLFVI